MVALYKNNFLTGWGFNLLMKMVVLQLYQIYSSLNNYSVI